MVRVLLALLLMGASHFAFTAPPSLDELAKQYERYGLPKADPTVRLARITKFDWQHLKSEPFNCKWELAFILKSTPYLEIRALVDSLEKDYVGDTIQWLDPNDELTDRQHPQLTVQLTTVLRAHQIGYRPLAESLRRLANESFSSVKLRRIARNYWFQELSNRTRARRDVVTYLRRIESDAKAAGEPIRYDDWIDALERCDIPTISNDPFDLLIDALADATDCSGEHLFTENWPRQPEVCAILEKGMDIVPTLIRHLDDARPTRDWPSQTSNERKSPRVVGEICGQLVEAILGRKMPGTANRLGSFEGRALIRDEVEKHWNQRKAFSEEAQIQRMIEEANQPNSAIDVHPSQSPVMLKMIHRRYPHILESLAKRATENKTEFQFLAHAIAESMLPLATKKTLLDSNLVVNGRAVIASWSALARVDPAGFQKRLHQKFDVLRQRTFVDEEREDLIQIMDDVEDKDTWHMFASILRIRPAEEQATWLLSLSVFSRRFGNIIVAEAMLNDTTLVSHPRSPYGVVDDRDETAMIELRNIACEKLAGKLGHTIPHDLDRPADEWAILRKWVRDELNRERGI